VYCQDESIDQDEGINWDVEVDRPINLEELSDLACNNDIKTAMDFICALKMASLDDKEDTCPKCDEPGYDQVTLSNSGSKIKKSSSRIPCHTMPIGPQLQALWWHPASIASLKYCDTRMAEIIEKLEWHNGLLESYNNFFYGSEYLEAINSGHIMVGDTVLMFSIDGAQLY